MPNEQHPQRTSRHGDERGDHVAQDVTADLREDRVADEDRPTAAASAGTSTVEEELGLWHAGEEVDAHHGDQED